MSKKTVKTVAQESTVAPVETPVAQEQEIHQLAMDILGDAQGQATEEPKKEEKKVASAKPPKKPSTKKVPEAPKKEEPKKEEPKKQEPKKQDKLKKEEPKKEEPKEEPKKEEPITVEINGICKVYNEEFDGYYIVLDMGTVYSILSCTDKRNKGALLVIPTIDIVNKETYKKAEGKLKIAYKAPKQDK